MYFISPIICIILCIIFIYLYLFIKIRRRYWYKRNVPFIRPYNFLLGSTADVILHGVPLVKYHQKLYNELESHKFGGYFNFLSPVLLIRDPEIIKFVLSKDFHHFMNRGSSFMDENEPLTLHLFNLQDEKWKYLRSKLTHTFSSSKIKFMYSLMKLCAEDLVNTINKAIVTEEYLEIKDIMSRFTTDIISSCVFGLESHSLQDPNSIFRIMGKKVLTMSLRNRIIGFLNSFFPKLRKLLQLKMINDDVTKFFQSLVTNTIDYREKNRITRNDFLDLLISLKANSKQVPSNEQPLVLTDNLLAAQCFVFFIAGFETSSGTLTFALYEIAKNISIQNKLREEIDNIFKEDSNFSYESLQKMIYLDKVINETLRMYPILTFLVRVCNKNYTLPNTNIIIDKDTRIIIPVLGLHYDSKYYTNPEEFNPENFSKEAKLHRPSYTYLPFGEGPRVCIGMRFGLMQVKLGLAILIRNFYFKLSNGPIEFDPKSFLLNAKDGVRLICSQRNLEEII